MSGTPQIMTLAELGTLRGRLAANPDTYVDPQVVARLVATVDQLMTGHLAAMEGLCEILKPQVVL